jgi:hypothetical protein
LKTSSEHSAVQDLFDDILLFTIYKFWGWGWGCMSTGDQVGRGQSQLDDIEDQVEASHQWWEG